MIALICARGGSKGVHRKNVKQFAGKPLIKWSIEFAKRNSSIFTVFVSTEDKEIAKVSKDSGALVPFLRPDALATDDAVETDVWKDTLNRLISSDFSVTENTEVCILPATSPLRRHQSFDRALKLYRKHRKGFVVGVCRASHNPYFNMVSLEDNSSRCQIVCPTPENITRRQSAPSVWNVTTNFYISDVRTIMSMKNLWSQQVLGVPVTEIESIDIDTELDFMIAEYLFLTNEEYCCVRE